MRCSGRQKAADIRPEQKWDFISLNDFKCTSCLTPFAYGYLYVSLIISIAVYAVDTFTAYNLLAFNKWSSDIQPFAKINFDITKWIFSACIIASWVNLGFEYIRAMRVIKRGAVAESYLDSLAVRLQSVRMGKDGRGWRRFLVFAALTESKKGTEYVALFTFFSFQAWIRILFCQGPRQVINALTLWGVFKAKLDPSDTKDVGSTLLGFFKNIGILAETDKRQAVILSGMLFTLVIWVFAALSLLLATLFYLLFLWHYIPKADGGLTGYCERKINTQLSKIVSVKVNKALEEEERKRIKADQKAVKNGEAPVFGRQATLPTLFDPKGDDKLPQVPMLNRNDTMATLPVYTSRPGTPSGQPTVPTLPGFELDKLDQKRPFTSRSTTSSSGNSFGSNAPLMGNASDMGYGRSDGRSGSPAPSVPSLPQLNSNGMPAGPQRSMTPNSTNGDQWNRGPPGALSRVPTGSIVDRGYTQSPVSYADGNGFGRNPQSRQPSEDSYGRPLPRAVAEIGGRSITPGGPPPSMGRRTPLDPNSAGRSSPASGYGSEYGRSSPAPSSPTSTRNQYQAYNPNPNMRSASAASPTTYSPTSQQAQYRNVTDPGRLPPGSDYFGNAPLPARPGTGQSGRRVNGNGYSGERAPPPRLASPASFNNRGSPGMGPGGQQGGYMR